MKREPDYPFQDIVSGAWVFYWRDCFGRRWLAEDRWGWFRVKIKERK